MKMRKGWLANEDKVATHSANMAIRRGIQIFLPQIEQDVITSEVWLIPNGQPR
jgi:hypothetical protein